MKMGDKYVPIKGYNLTFEKSSNIFVSTNARDDLIYIIIYNVVSQTHCICIIVHVVKKVMKLQGAWSINGCGV